VTARELYRGAAPGWASGAERVYLPLAHALVAWSPVELRGQLVLDAGSGTGAGSKALTAVGARPIALDLELDMLRHEQAARPAAVVADVERVPVASGALDAVLAPFVLNHVSRPVEVLQELARTVRSGGVLLASTFAEDDRPAIKDLLDEVVTRHGWVPPASYTWMKAQAIPLSSSADRMTAVARRSGLTDVAVTTDRIDVGVSSPADLVAYRFGVAHQAQFWRSLSADERAAIVAEAEEAVAAHHDGSDLAPAVVRLAAVVA
jgi:SAM-dependent methyltransferase